MTYTIGEGVLQLRCKIDNLKFRVLFSDPDNNEQAFCLPSYSSTLCHHHYSNGSINQNLFTNETVFTIHGNINTNVNGKWICRHGNNFERATVDVKVDSITGIYNLKISLTMKIFIVDHSARIKYRCIIYLQLYIFIGHLFLDNPYVFGFYFSRIHYEHYYLVSIKHVQMK